MIGDEFIGALACVLWNGQIRCPTSNLLCIIRLASPDPVLSFSFAIRWILSASIASHMSWFYDSATGAPFHSTHIPEELLESLPQIMPGRVTHSIMKMERWKIWKIWKIR